MESIQKQLSNRTFCLQMAGIMLLLSLLQFTSSKWYYWIPLILGLLFLIIAITRPSTINGFQKIWIAAGDLAGRVSSFILLSIFYLFVITPLAVLLRLFDSQMVSSFNKFKTDIATYWQDPEQVLSSMKNQF